MNLNDGGASSVSRYPRETSLQLADRQAWLRWQQTLVVAFRSNIAKVVSVELLAGFSVTAFWSGLFGGEWADGVLNRTRLSVFLALCITDCSGELMFSVNGGAVGVRTGVCTLSSNATDFRLHRCIDSLVVIDRTCNQIGGSDGDLGLFSASCVDCFRRQAITMSR